MLDHSKQINDIQASNDLTMIITASKDATAKVFLHLANVVDIMLYKYQLICTLWTIIENFKRIFDWYSKMYYATFEEKPNANEINSQMLTIKDMD